MKSTAELILTLPQNSLHFIYLFSFLLVPEYVSPTGAGLQHEDADLHVICGIFKLRFSSSSSSSYSSSSSDVGDSVGNDVKETSNERVVSDVTLFGGYIHF